MSSPFLLEEIFEAAKPKRLIHGEHYFQIPPNADVMAIPFISLPSVIKKKFHLLDRYIDDNKAPHVIFVYPVLKRFFQTSHRRRTINGEHSRQTFSEENHRILSPITPNKPESEIEREPEECLLPLRSCREIASTILQLCQASVDRRTSLHDENLMPNFRQTLLFNLRVVNIKASCLCMYKNGIYLLPEYKTDDSKKQAEEQEFNENVEKSRSGHIKTQDTLEMRSRPETSPYIYLDDENISTNGLLNPSILEKHQDEDRFYEPQFSPISSCSSQYEPLPEDIAPIKRKVSPCDVVEDTKRRNSSSSSDSEMDYGSDISDISSISSAMDLQLAPENMPEISPDVTDCSFPPPKESVEPTSVPSLNQMTSVESPIPPASYSLQVWANSESRPSTPSSAVTISTDSLESFESDQSESSESSSSSQSESESESSSTSEEDCIPSILEQDETTKDEIIQRLQQRVKEWQEAVENMRNKSE